MNQESTLTRSLSLVVLVMVGNLGFPKPDPKRSQGTVIAPIGFVVRSFSAIDVLVLELCH